MRRVSVLSVFCILATGLLAQETAPSNFTPLNAKTGLWQMTEAITWVGLPPQVAASLNNGHASLNYKSCVKPKDLSTNPWAEGSGHKCHWTALSSTGSDMEVRGEGCDMGRDWGMTADIKGTIHLSDSQDGTGTFDIVLTGNGQTMHGHATYTGHWVSASCPADM